MRKFLALMLTLASVGFAATSAEAKAAVSADSVGAVNVSKAAPAAAQIWRGRRDRRRARVVTQSRLVRRGRQVWRETYQVRYLPNGRTQTRLISRVRVR
ncbi:MAG TPA: hypothetical protein VF668_22940 [Pyrinomonadaceae bacterium]|jgi:hypothetical protein